MANFELMRYVTVGQFVPGQSFLHKLDARSKLIAFIVLLIGISASTSFSSQALACVLGVVGFLAAKIPLRYGLSGLRPALYILSLMFVLDLVLYGGPASSPALIHAGHVRITMYGLHLALVATLKFINIVFLVSLLTLSTPASMLTQAIEQLLSPLKRLRIPVAELVMICNIALRFVPTLALEGERLMKAQAARGADFGTAKWWQIVRRARSVIPIIVPLIVNSLRRGEQLVEAMEARGYEPGRTRSSFVRLSWGTRDNMTIMLSLILLTLYLWCPLW